MDHIPCRYYWYYRERYWNYYKALHIGSYGIFRCFANVLFATGKLLILNFWKFYFRFSCISPKDVELNFRGSPLGYFRDPGMFCASIFDLFGEKSPVPRVTQSPWLLISFVNILSDLARLLTMDNGDIISLKFDIY